MGGGGEKSAAQQRIGNYKKETMRLCEELKFERNAASNADSQSLFVPVDQEGDQMEDKQSLVFEKQKAKMASGTHQLRSALSEIRDTEEIGLGIMEQLAHDRETIMRVDQNVGRSDESLSR